VIPPVPPIDAPFDGPWRARWICAASAGAAQRPDQWQCFRRRLSLGAAPARAVPQRGREHDRHPPLVLGQVGILPRELGQPGLLFQLDADGTPCDSGSAWKARCHPGMGGTGLPRPNFRLPEGNIRIDARSGTDEWAHPDFDDTAWPDAQEMGIPPCAPWGRL
jgi:hypothetical protein